VGNARRIVVRGIVVRGIAAWIGTAKFETGRRTGGARRTCGMLRVPKGNGWRPAGGKSNAIPGIS
jgi:hypothetical protein